MLVGVLLTCSLRSVGSAAKSWVSSAETADGYALAHDLIGEIVRLPYEDTNQTPIFGAETGELGTPATRAALEDLDDYMNLTDTPPKNRAGTALPGYTGWQRTADVEKVNPSGYALQTDASSDAGLRVVTVRVVSPSGGVTTLKAYRTKVGGCLQPQGTPQTLITWAGCTVQVGGAPAIVGGTTLNNHAADE